MRRPQPLQSSLGIGIFRVELERPAVIGNRPVVVALGLIGETAAAVGEAYLHDGGASERVLGMREQLTATRIEDPAGTPQWRACPAGAGR